MSLECPNGHGFQNIIQNLTVDGSAPKKSGDVVAMKLRCGCVVGGKHYQDFQNRVSEIRKEEKSAMIAAQEEARLKLGAAYKAFAQEAVS